MTFIVVHIARLVVHGAEAFAAEAFSENLREEIIRRIGQEASAGDIAQRLQGGASVAQHGAHAGQTASRPAPASHASRTPEGAAAAELAGRLVR